MKTGLPRHLMMTYSKSDIKGICVMWNAATYVLALGDGGKVNLDLGHGQDIGRCGHVNQEICDEVSQPTEPNPSQKYPPRINWPVQSSTQLNYPALEYPRVPSYLEP